MMGVWGQGGQLAGMARLPASSPHWGLAIPTFLGYSLPTEISDFPRKYTGKMDGAITPTK